MLWIIIYIWLLWSQGKSQRLVIGRSPVRFPSVLEQGTEPQTAFDVLVGMLHGIHHHQCINVCMYVWLTISHFGLKPLLNVLCTCKCTKKPYRVSSDAYKHRADVPPDSWLFKHVLVMRSCPLEAEDSIESKGPKIQSTLLEWQHHYSSLDEDPFISQCLWCLSYQEKAITAAVGCQGSAEKKIPLIFLSFVPQGLHTVLQTKILFISDNPWHECF